MEWWGWLLVVLVIAVFLLWRARSSPAGYLDRTKGRVALWAASLDDVEALLDRDPLPVDALLRIEAKLHSLAEAQRRERVPHVGVERRNAATTRLFEVERNVIQDMRTTGGKNLRVIGEERWGLLNELGLAELVRARDKASH